MPLTFGRKKYAPKKSKSRKPITRATVANIARKVTRQDKPTKEIRFSPFKNLKTDVLSNSFEVIDMTNIGPGDLSNQRNGREIVLTGVRYNLVFDNARVEERFIRIMVLQPKNANDPPDLSTWTDLYQDEVHANRAADMLAGDLITTINTDVYHVYADKSFKLSSLGNDGTAKHMQGYLRLNKRLMYDNQGGSSNVPVDGGQIYFIVHACEVTSVSGSTAVVTGYHGLLRVFFKDT